MRDKLQKLGFTEKEAAVYLALLEFGTQPASVIARKTGLQRPTVLFLFDALLKKGYIRKSQRGRVQYFFVDLKDFEEIKARQLAEDRKTFAETIPLLAEFKNPFTSQPKVTFFEGIDGCRKAYSTILESKSEVLEFAAHNDLTKMGEDFMANFVKERVRRKVFMKAICHESKTHKDFKKLDKKQARKLHLFSPDLGGLYSSIDIFEDKILLLNLYQDAFAILIQNKEVAETLKTIHGMVWDFTN